LIESATSPNSTYSDVNCAIKFFGLVQKYRFPLNSNDWIQLKSRQADTISFFPFEMKSRAWNNLPAPLAALFDEDILLKRRFNERRETFTAPQYLLPTSFHLFFVFLGVCCIRPFFFPPSAVAY
jgi:hypothetical protein